MKQLRCVRMRRARFKPIPGTEFELPADLVLLAMGFVHPVHEGMVRALALALDARGNVKADTDDYRSSIDKVFAAGDMRRGQSLVVWAIREGRQAAHAVDEYLMGASDLPRVRWASERAPTGCCAVGLRASGMLLRPQAAAKTLPKRRHLCFSRNHAMLRSRLFAF